MNIVNNSRLSKVIILLLVNCGLYVQTINAEEWQAGFVTKSSFSDFSPPANVSEYQNNLVQKQWGNGRSFNEENKVRYSPVTTKNPWKPVKSSHQNKAFASQRPWGNVPERKPGNKNSMKFHDERFKQWSHQQDSFYRNSANEQSSLLFPGAYAYPGTGYGAPLMMPSIYPGSILNTGGYGFYPGRALPYTGLYSRPGFW